MPVSPARTSRTRWCPALIPQRRGGLLHRRALAALRRNITVYGVHYSTPELCTTHLTDPRLWNFAIVRPVCYEGFNDPGRTYCRLAAALVSTTFRPAGSCALCAVVPRTLTHMSEE
ncbi:hypothetical protein DHEL01_v204938 [Diaporthe helianthi]|uniref:Uncharacterized protein n=1 Tax=Diaporthe helianthi TaxID=158607 RepID=A0A2P5I2E4_DIAHE|nr:hypothetical protein DHEL01_v204938 [Diaporthe helianthi]